MKACPSFETCNASLCPLDPDLSKRVWYIDEDICSGRAGSGVRWIKKQRSVAKRKPKSYRDRPISHKQLYDNSRPRVMTEEQRAELQERGRKLAENRKKVKIKSTPTMVITSNNLNEG